MEYSKGQPPVDGARINPLGLIRFGMHWPVRIYSNRKEVNYVQKNLGDNCERRSICL